jgi:hypothetical protein
MSLAAWIVIGIGVFILYAAVKGRNPLAMIAERFGIPSTASPTVGAP